MSVISTDYKLVGTNVLVITKTEKGVTKRFMTRKESLPIYSQKGSELVRPQEFQVRG